MLTVPILQMRRLQFVSGSKCAIYIACCMCLWILDMGSMACRAERLHVSALIVNTVHMMETCRPRLPMSQSGPPRTPNHAESACRDDDEMRTGLRAHITALMPQEVILPKGSLSSTTSKVLRASLRNPRQHSLTPRVAFWDADRTLQEVQEAKYFTASETGQTEIPQALQVRLWSLLPVNCIA